MCIVRDDFARTRGRCRTGLVRFHRGLIIPAVRFGHGN
jgi:hypothetical protein